MSNISKILIPDLPKTKYIIKYLKKIDENHIYSNFGPLNIELINKLESLWENQVNIITTSSGTISLLGAILAKTGYAKDNKKICIVPAYTFVGTISSILSAGYTPLLFDITSDWDMDIDEIKAHHLFENVGLIVPVSTYGKNVDIDKWENFTKETGIPVIIDAAASFDTLNTDYLKKIENCVLCISLHATKSFGIGEGGLILSSKNNDKEKFIRAINFGFFNSRESYGYSINGKMSEYHAAVGLASFDFWEEKIKHFNEIKNLYEDTAIKCQIDKHIVCGPPISYSYCLFIKPPEIDYELIKKQLDSKKIDQRLWYNHGLNKQPQYLNINTSRLNYTQTIADSLIGIPMHLKLTESDIEEIISCIANILFT